MTDLFSYHISQGNNGRPYGSSLDFPSHVSKYDVQSLILVFSKPHHNPTLSVTRGELIAAVGGVEGKR